MGAAIDIGEDVALADVPGHLVAAFEACNTLDSDARSALVMTMLEADGCEVHLNGAPVPQNTPVSLCPGALLSFGGVTYTVERDARAHA